MDSGTGLAVLGSAIGGAKLLEKLLGPTADYLGEGLKAWSQKRIENVSRIFCKARDKLGERIDTPGAIPPKILKGILDDGSFCDDDLASEYFAGVMAASRTPVGRDDRAAAYLNLTTQLSVYQIRSHYVIYSAIKRTFDGRDDMRPGEQSDAHKFRFFIPSALYAEAMALQEPEDITLIASHAINGLHRLSLIRAECVGYCKDMLEKENATIHGRDNGFIAQPDSFGFEYYLWVHGRGDLPITRFLSGEFAPIPHPGVSISPDFIQSLWSNESA